MAEPLTRKIMDLQRLGEDLKRFWGREDGAGRKEEISGKMEELLSRLQDLLAAQDEARRQNLELAAARQRAELEHRRYQDLFHLAPDGYLITDPEGIIREANRAAAILLRLRPASLIGKALPVFLAEPHRREFYRRLQRFRKGTTKTSQEWEVRLQPPKGPGFCVALAITALPGPQGNPIALRWMLRDITRYKQDEDALRETTRKLRSLSARLLTLQESERKWIAQKLQDGIGHSLSVIKFAVEHSLQQISGPHLAPALKPMEAILPVLQQGIEEAHRLAMDLWPPVLEDLGALASISWFAREFEKNYPAIHLRRQIEVREEDIPQLLKIVLFRVLQEALTNAARHSGAERVVLSLRRKAERIELLIEDNGVGLPALLPSTGLGLASMRERVKFSGGSLDIRSGKTGTTLRAVFPRAQMAFDFLSS